MRTLLIVTALAVTALAPVNASANPCHVHAGLPDRACTPGAVFPSATVKRICQCGYTRRVRSVPERVKDLVYRRYGITRHSRASYEMDYLAPLELGGGNKQANLWPEPAKPRPGFHEKDVLGERASRQRLRGRMKRSTAQRLISTNWLGTYRALVYSGTAEATRNLPGVIAGAPVL